jgi:hypothetical protein
MRGARFCGRVVTAVAVVAGGVVGAPATGSGSPAQGAPDIPTTQVTTTVSMSCDGGAPADVGFLLTVPTSVRAGRPFPLEIAVDGTALPDTAAGYVRLSISGSTATEVTVAVEGTTHLVAPWAPPKGLTVTITGYGVIDPADYFETSCAADAPTPAAAIAVRHATPFAAALLTAEQRVGLFCLNYPGGWPDGSVDTVAVTVPNQVAVGQPFTIDAPGDVDVSGGVRSGQTVTPTGAVGDTVDFSYDGSYTVTFPPPYPPAPARICSQRGGPVHLASVPIVAR